jgi:hypothetical protein
MATNTTRSHDKNNTYKKKPRIRISSLSPELVANTITQVMWLKLMEMEWRRVEDVHMLNFYLFFNLKNKEKLHIKLIEPVKR